MKVNIEHYRKLINDDAKWLVDNTRNCLEREHILKVLWDSIECYYPDVSQQDVVAYAENRCARCGTILDDGKCWQCIGDGGNCTD